MLAPARSGSPTLVDIRCRSPVSKWVIWGMSGSKFLTFRDSDHDHFFRSAVALRFGMRACRQRSSWPLHPHHESIEMFAFCGAVPPDAGLTRSDS